jgi:hypothetical protein
MSELLINERKVSCLDSNRNEICKNEDFSRRKSDFPLAVKHPRDFFNRNYHHLKLLSDKHECY